jgi:3-oxoacyl-[acyl-carrier-protein] synthase III
MARYAHITGWGMSVPKKVLTNHDLVQMVETNDEWIHTRTGIKERRIAEAEQTTASLGFEAALHALEIAHVKPADVDLIIVATSSPEHIFPATACSIQDRLGASNAGAFDLLAACSGFIFALNMAAQAIRTGSINTALVIGSETLSRIVNWQDRDTCILFGDGAGAFVIQGSKEPGGVLSAVMRSDGSGGDLLSLPAGGSRLPANHQTVKNGYHYIHMNGREVFRFATRVMTQATREAVERANLTMEDIDLLIPHQANQRIIDTAMKNLNIPSERCMVNLERYGNTSTASIPIAAVEAVEKNRIKPGDHVVFVGFGAGLTWGAMAIEWSEPFIPGRTIRPSHYQGWARVRSFIRRLFRQIEGLIWGRD